MPNDGLENSKPGMQTLLSKINSGAYRIPVFQRNYVWKKKDVIRLMDSIFHDYPTGALLILADIDKKIGLDSKPFYGVTNPPDECKYYVLDGQQRLTSCYHVFYDKGKSYRYFIDLHKLFKVWKGSNGDNDAIDFSSCVKTKGPKASTDEISGCDLPFSLIRTQESFSKQRVAFADKMKKQGKSPEFIEFIEIKLDSLLKPFIDYRFSSIDLSESLTMSAICRIFETLNNTGMKLDSFDICVAKFMRDEINLKERIHNAKETFPILKVLFNNDQYRETPLQVIALTQKKDSHLKNKLVESITADDIKGHIDESFKALSRTMEILDSVGAGTSVSLKIVPYPAIIPTIASALISCHYFDMDQTKKATIENRIHKYYYISCFTQRFLQGAASMIKTDYDNLVKWFNDSVEPDFITAGLSWNDEMICSVKNNYGAMACAIYSLINTSGPKDFYSKKTVKAFESGIDLHHVFPKKHYDKKINVNLALNMAFLEKATNESIGSESTVHYSDNIIEDVYENSEAQFKSIMATQLIDDNAYSDFRKEDYENFIKHRMDAVVKKLTSEYGVTVNKIKKENITEEQQSDFNEDQDDETI